MAYDAQMGGNHLGTVREADLEMGVTEHGRKLNCPLLL